MINSRTLRAASLCVGLLALIACSGGGNSPDAPQSLAQTNNPSGLAANAFAPETTFTVTLTNIVDGSTDSIEIPNGRPVYALLVSGFHQNRNLDMFHYYNFAKCLFEADAYVHYAWWNNLLAPYMERPLHDENSVPSTDGFPEHDIVGFLPGFAGCDWSSQSTENNSCSVDPWQSSGHEGIERWPDLQERVSRIPGAVH